MKIIVILTIHKLTGTSNILENNNVRLNLEYLCPGIDICNPNQPDSLVNSNAIYNGDKASCCHGEFIYIHWTDFKKQHIFFRNIGLSLACFYL